MSWFTRTPRAVRTPEQEVDRVRNTLSFALVGSFIGALIDFTLQPIPPANKDIITYMVGQLSGMALMVLGYYFASKIGAAALDAKRDATTAKMADAVTAAINASPPPLPTPDVSEAAQVVADAAQGAADDITGKGEPS